MPRVLNRYKHSAEGAVYIGRGSKWGNPYVIGKDGTRAEVIAKHKADVEADPEYMEMIKRELKGRDLICFCAPHACHGDTYLAIANPDIKVLEPINKIGKFIPD